MCKVRVLITQGMRFVHEARPFHDESSPEPHGTALPPGGGARTNGNNPFVQCATRGHAEARSNPG
jgi:hypothetical protein